MFSTKDYPILGDVTVPEIIDELERQFDAKLCEVQGVREGSREREEMQGEEAQALRD